VKPMDKVREALELLEYCRSSHFDFSGALVHHENAQHNQLDFDAYCPKCVIPKAIMLIREALASPEAAPAPAVGVESDNELADKWLGDWIGEYDPDKERWQKAKKFLAAEFAQVRQAASDTRREGLTSAPAPLGKCKWSSDSHVFEETCEDWKPESNAGA
jgi:hypothetical protein